MIFLLVALLARSELPVNEKTIEFARSKLGQRVGNGECTALVMEALRYAGARRRWPGQRSWGDELKSLRDARPGDILQFENAEFVRTSVSDDVSHISVNIVSFPHHTAIVSRVRKPGPKPILVIVHQNAGLEGSDKKIVQEMTIDIAAKKRGNIKAYRPVAQ
jgi:hypothetical protein